MQKTYKLFGILVFLILFLVFTNNSFAMSIMFDEYGNGQIGDPATGVKPLNPVFPAVDPISGWPTLMYPLPFLVQPGDLFLYELQNPSPNAPSDLVRFVNVQDATGAQHGEIFFFSDGASELDGALADTQNGLPAPTTQYPLLYLDELPLFGGPTEVTDGIIYTPNPGQPGFFAAGSTYTIVSDGKVPEPSTLALLGIGAVSLLAYAWKQRKA
jgi:hypothetical protein